MSRATVISPDVFLLHASRLRARRLHQIALSVPGELRIHALPSRSLPAEDKPLRVTLTSVFRNLHTRNR